MDKQNDKICVSMRELIGNQLDQALFSKVEEEGLQAHLASCNDCAHWQSDHLALISLAKNLPQYDVSEALTQKILKAVETAENPAISKTLQTGAMASAAVVLLVVSSFDNPLGWMSWAIGLMAMRALQLLIDQPASHVVKL